MNIAMLLSGGVDSSVAVHLLKEQGYTPSLFYIKIGIENDPMFPCSWEEDVHISSLMARKYGCSLEIVDLHEEYWDKVIAYTLEKVRSGLTPNPDVMCNKLIKFGVFEEKVGKHFDKIATGHYATTTLLDGNIYLSTAKDTVKDQTDFLAQIDNLLIEKLLFPIGHLMKSEVRHIAQMAKLPTAKRPDSQGICFLGKVQYDDFIRRYLGEKEGNIVEWETGNMVGKHAGFWFYTIGQRKGLQLSGGPWYVIKKDVAQNIVYVSKGYDVETQYGYTFAMDNFHYITANPWQDITKETAIYFKIRHTPIFTKGKIRLSEKKYFVVSDEKLQGIAPGQFGVIYDNNAKICIGSGEISV